MVKHGNISDSSLKIYLSNLGTIAKAIDYKEDPSSSGKWIEEHIKEILAYIDGLNSKHTKKNKIASLVVFGNMFDIKASVLKQLTERMDKLAGEINDQYSTNEMTDTEKENWIGEEEISAKIIQLRDKIPKAIDKYTDYKTVVRYLMLLIHHELPLRNDLADAKIVFSDNEATNADVNYIVLNKKGKTAKIILNNYKTKKVYHQKSIDIPQPIAKELIKYQPIIYKFSPNGWFIVSRDATDKPITRNSYTKLFQEIFADTGKSVSTTQVRRAIVSKLYAPTPDELKKKQQLASVMGHSVDMAMKVYSKIETPSEK